MLTHREGIGLRYLLTGLGSVVFLFLVGCSSTRVRTDYDEGASFIQLKTYDWIDQPVDAGGNPAVNSPLVQKRTRNAIDSELLRKGFQKATTRDPDFLVAIHVVTDEKVEVTTIDQHYGYSCIGYRRFGHGWYGHRYYGRYPYHGYFGPVVGTTQYVNEYLKGTLIVDIVDPRENELIWRGWASQALDDDPRPEKVQMYIDAAVRKILDEFPPGA